MGNKVKKENLKQRAYLNSITSLIDYGSRLITNFVVTPFLVNGLGSTLFGVWKVVEQFSSYTKLGDVKATEVLKWAISKDREVKTGQELREYVTITFILLLFSLPFFLITGIILAWYSPIITGVEEQHVDLVRTTTAILIFSVVISKIFGTFESILRGMNLGFKKMGIRALIILVTGGLQILAVLNNYSLIALANIQLLATITSGIIIYYIIKTNVPWFGFGTTTFKKSISFLKVSGWFVLWSFLKLIILSSDKVLLGYLGGALLVTKFVITEYVIKAGMGVVTKLIYGVIPGFGKLYGAGELQKLAEVRNIVMLCTWLLATSIGATVVIFNSTFIELWIGNDEYGGDIVNLLLIIMTAQFIFIQNDGVLINITLKIREKVFYAGLTAGTTLILIFLLVPRYEIAGLCISIIIGRMFMSVAYPKIVNRELKDEKQTFTIPYRIIITTILVFIGSFMLSPLSVNIDNWYSLAILSIIFWISILPFVYFTGLSREQRDKIFKVLQNVNLKKLND